MLNSRRSIRLKNYDYSQPNSYYYITINSFKQQHVFGKIVDKKMQLNLWGSIVKNEWLKTSQLRHYVTLDEFVVMPNHFHGILFIGESDTTHHESGRKFGKPIAKSLPTIVGAFKSAVTNKINKSRGVTGISIWQRNYYERVLRGEYDLLRIREYIKNNPSRW